MTTTAAGTATTPRRGGGARRRRDVQRALHIVVGVAVLAQVYAAGAIGPVGTLIVQCVVAPVLVLSGLYLWKGHRLRRLWQDRARRGA
jgi:hypothetical protein